MLCFKLKLLPPKNDKSRLPITLDIKTSCNNLIIFGNIKHKGYNYDITKSPSKGRS